MAFAVLALSQLVHAFSVRSSHSLFRIGFHTNKYMLGAFAVSSALMLAVLLIPPLQTIFGIAHLTGAAWGVVAGLSVVPLAVMEIVKGIQALVRWSKSRKAE